MNRLAREKSPYLLQHAHNPVDWFPWSDEALQKAKDENKPILLSIGYATCHWCHVMERESFENEEVASFMNENFVNIKIDREERPDLDQIYMEAVQLVNGGHGGWPLHCFLLPDKKPFYGGTYFPPKSAQGRPSWMTVLQHIQQLYKNKKEELIKQADQIMNHIQLSEHSFTVNNAKELERLSLLMAYEQLKDNFDDQWGGFGRAPKFPSFMSLQVCLMHFYHFGDLTAMNHLQLSLDAMIYGGIYDQLGSGLSRYSTDDFWLAPHFEKMLYDNALLMGILADSYKITEKKLYWDTLFELKEWLKRDMTHTEGAFYSAIDADSEGEEGKYYLWTKAEIDSILGEQSPLFCQYYDVKEEGNWEGKTILRRIQSLNGFCETNKLDPQETELSLQKSREKLFRERQKRSCPITDTKILCSWNAMMISGLVKAFLTTSSADFLQMAIQSFQYLEKNFIDEDHNLWHTHKQQGFLEDYAFFIEACLQLYLATFDLVYLERAKQLTFKTIELFGDNKEGMFFFTASTQTDIIHRKKEIFDHAQPSANSIMQKNLSILAMVYDLSNFREMALQSIHNMSESICKYPQSFSSWLQCAYAEVFGYNELLCQGTLAPNAAIELQKNYISPYFLLCQIEDSLVFPIAQNRIDNRQNLCIYLCKNYQCFLPSHNITDALKQIQKRIN